MSKLSAIVRNRDDVTIDYLGADLVTTVPVTVIYRPRLMTLKFREEFATYLAVLVKAQQAAQAAEAREDVAGVQAAMNTPEADKAAEAISAMTLSLVEGWDLTDDDETGKEIPVPFPGTAEEIKNFVAPDLFQTVMQAVMGKLNPNQRAGETKEQSSPAT